MSNNQMLNGWTNYETWNFNLWEMDFLSESIRELNDGSEDGLEYGQVYEMVNGHVDHMLESLDLHSSFISDVIGHAIQQVNVHEITEHLMNDLND